MHPVDPSLILFLKPSHKSQLVEEPEHVWQMLSHLLHNSIVVDDSKNPGLQTQVSVLTSIYRLAVVLQLVHVIAAPIHVRHRLSQAVHNN